MTTATYRKSATKEIRPFFGLATLENALDHAQIRLFEDQPYTDANSFTVEEHDVRRLNITLRPNIDAKALISGSASAKKLLLAVTALNPFMKRTALVLKLPLANNSAVDEVCVGAEMLDSLGGGSSVTIEIALCLAQHLPKKPGSPFLLGHWLSKKTFEIRPPKLSEEFDVAPMDDKDWIAMGMPPKTLYFIDYCGGVNEPANKDRPLAKVLIHSDVFKKLSVDSNQKMGKPLMSFLAAEIACQILAASVSDWKDIDQAEQRSPLSAFLKRINRVQSCSIDQLRKLVEEPGMQRLRAILHADQQSVRQVAEA
jgi:hypothetical protein